MSIVYTLVFLLFPALALFIAHHQRWAQKMGVILLCYLAGLLAGNLGLVPAAANNVQQTLSEASVVLALPMLLFTLDIRRWSKMAGTALVSMLLATTSVVALATLLFYLFRGEGVESTSYLAAMSVGVYTGGTPNLAAIKAALDIPHGQYILFHSLDTLIGGAYILFMLTVGIPLFRRLLDAPRALIDVTADTAVEMDDENYAPLFQSENLSQLLKILLLSILILGLSLGLSELLKRNFALTNSSAITIILITTLGMAASFSSRVRGLSLAYKTGMYLIYVFCFAVATMASLDDIARASSTITILYWAQSLAVCCCTPCCANWPAWTATPL